MEKKLSECYNKNYKKWLVLLTIVAIAVVLCFSGTLIYYQQILTSYTVEYISGDNNVLIQTYSKGDRLKLPNNPQKEGYEFVGWTLDKEARLWVGGEIVINKELMLYAQWQEKTYQIKYLDKNYIIKYDCSFLVEDSSIIFVDINNNMVKINASTKDGYSFWGWELGDNNFSMNVNSLNFNEFESSCLNLTPIYVAREASFLISKNTNYSITNLSHNNSIAIGETLYFDIVLNENVSKSKINVVASNGNINKIKNNNVYNVEVADFTRDFEVYIDNVDINEYRITFIDDMEMIEKSVRYGEYVSFPNFYKEGHTLIGFKDTSGNFYDKDFIVTKDLILTACYEVNSYTITFPKSNGTFLISYADNYLIKNVITKNYMDSLEFEVKLSNAYSNSNLNVYALVNGEKVLPIVSNNKYVFEYIKGNTIIYIENITINTYSLIVDGNNYGKVSYGSFVSVIDDGLLIKDEANSLEIRIKSEYADDFVGWILENGSLLTNSSIQELTSTSEVIIYSNFVKKNL